VVPLVRLLMRRRPVLLLFHEEFFMSKVSAPFVRSPYNYDLAAASDEAAHVCVGESLTVQSQSEDADINVLMRRYGVTGKMPENLRIPEYGDFEGISDFATALNQVEATANEFMRIPAEIRSKFDNDPQKFLMFCADESNDEYLRKTGLKRPYTDEELVAREERRKSTPEYKIAQLEAQLAAAQVKPA
jgi:hypothetical protein